jgi:hypothetical protein
MMTNPIDVPNAMPSQNVLRWMGELFLVPGIFALIAALSGGCDRQMDKSKDCACYWCCQDADYNFQLHQRSQKVAEETAFNDLQRLAGKWAKLRTLRNRAFFGAKP